MSEKMNARVELSLCSPLKTYTSTWCALPSCGFYLQMHNLLTDMSHTDIPHVCVWRVTRKRLRILVLSLNCMCCGSILSVPRPALVTIQLPCDPHEGSCTFHNSIHKKGIWWNIIIPLYIFAWCIIVKIQSYLWCTVGKNTLAHMMAVLSLSQDRTGLNLCGLCHWWYVFRHWMYFSLYHIFRVILLTWNESSADFTVKVGIVWEGKWLLCVVWMELQNQNLVFLELGLL